MKAVESDAKKKVLASSDNTESIRYLIVQDVFSLISLMKKYGKSNFIMTILVRKIVTYICILVVNRYISIN